MNIKLAKHHVSLAHADETFALRNLASAQEFRAYGLPRMAHHSEMSAIDNTTGMLGANNMWVRAIIAILSPPE